MSMQYCESCNQIIDTDYNAEHFEPCEECGATCEHHKCKETKK